MKRSLLVKFKTLVVLLFLTASANATDYYVDASTTSSTQSGTLANPWKTIAQVNSKMNTFNAGDNIYFKKGQIYTGQLTITRSGTATSPLTFSSYGTGAQPIFSGSGDLLNVYQRSYVVINDINFTDVNMDPNNHSAEAVVDRGVYIDNSTNITVQNCSFSLIGVGLYIDAAGNTVDHCTFENLRMIRNTPGGDDDYGANPVVISGANNSILNSTFKECWAPSYDYGYDGGAIEIYGGGTNNTRIMYNTAINCEGFMEIGSGNGGSSNDNLVAYNKIINCGKLVWISNSGNYAISVTNLQFYNNVIVHTVNQFLMENRLIGMQGSSSVQGMVVAKNNIFWLTQGMDVAQSGQWTGGQLVHENNVYKLASGSVLNFTQSASEVITTNGIFTNTSSTDPSVWDFNPGANSPAVDFGQNVNITKDFAGNTVGTPPNAGILEGGTSTPAPLAVTATAGTINCNGGTTTVTVAATGGTQPYSGTGTFTKAAGTYNFTVTDAAGGSKTTSVVITEPVALTAVATAGTIATYGGTTTITTVAAGGTPTYTYSLNNGTFQTANTFTNIPAGTHTITVKDSKGCTVIKSLNITQPAPPALSAASTAGTINCNGGTTTVTVTATGGIAPYTGTGTFTKTAGTFTFTVTDAAGATATTSQTITEPLAISATISASIILVYGGTAVVTTVAVGGTLPYSYSLNNGAFQTSNIFLNVAAGSHTITVKDAKGCTLQSLINISQPAPPPALTVSAASGTINCNGSNTAVTITAAGGTGGYTYSFNNGAYQTGNVFSGVVAGTYVVKAKDAAGTVATNNITLAQPTAITATVTSGTITVNGGTTNITTIATGGTAPYTYQLNTGVFQTSNIFNGVVSGTYNITIKDANNCSITKNITITEPGAVPALIATATSGIITCNGASTTVTVSATGGTAPYTGTGSFSRAAGTWSFIVTDAAGVKDTVTLTITQPTAITATVSAGTIAVNGGSTSITVTASAGTPGYTYSLNSGAYQTSNVFNNISAGTYTVTIKDANNCTLVKSIIITQPAPIPALVANATSTLIGCNGGNATVTVSATGGTAPYTGTGTFVRAAGTWSFIVTDAAGVKDTATLTITQPVVITSTLSAGTITINGGTTTLTVLAAGGTPAYSYSLNGGAYQTSNVFTNIVAGTYSVTVKDANGCTLSKNITVTQPNSIPTLVATASATAINCNGGTTTVTVSASGGTSPYTGTGSFIKTAGTWSFIVSDAGGRKDTAYITIAQPTAITSTVSAGTIAVNGGTTTITVAAGGGTPAYSYSLNGSTYQTTNTFTNVTAGVYTVTVKDAKGCTLSKSISITQPGAVPTLVATANAGTISCNGGNTNVTVSATGGTAPYTGTGTYTKTAGTWSFIVTDATGLKDTAFVTIAQPTALAVSITAGTISVYGGSTTVTVTATGGSGSYTYSLDNGNAQTSNIFTGVVSGNHSIQVKDARGCSNAKSFVLTQPEQTAPLSVKTQQKDVVCQGSNSGVIIASATGGKGPYLFKINNENYSNNYTFNNLTSGNYTVTVMDSMQVVSSTIVNLQDGKKNCKGIKVIVMRNPAIDEFEIRIETESTDRIQITLVNVNGQLVYQGAGKANDVNRFGRGLAGGFYVAKILQGKNMATAKLIKSN